MRRIIGGGLSGLAAAVNFAKEGEKVEVHEKRDNVGDQFHANYQVLLDSHGDAKSYLKDWGLKPDFTFKLITNNVWLMHPSATRSFAIDEELE